MQQDLFARNWDGWRIFLAMAQTGTLRGAAERLQVNHATVSRQLADFEQALGVQLFERSKIGYRLSPAGQAMLPQAEALHTQLYLMHEQVSGADNLLAGEVSLTLVDSMVSVVLPLLAKFREDCPDITVTVHTNNQPENLKLREVDLALRTTRSPPENLAGRRIGQQSAALYASPELAGTLGKIPLNTMPWIGWSRQWQHLPDAQWQVTNVPEANIICRVDSPSGMLAALKAGLGVAHCITWLADREQLLCIGEPVASDWLDLWILMHPDARRVARVSAFADYLVNALRPVIQPYQKTVRTDPDRT
jgi:DNA-binding transcriptional LysR family regulator